MNGYNFSDASDIKLGGSTITALYYGSTLLWPLERDYSKEYLTIEPAEWSDPLKIYFRKNNDNISRSIQYSKDKTNWTTISFGTTDNPTIIDVNQSEKIYLKGLNSSYAESTNDGLSYCNINFLLNGYAVIYGNIMSLIYGDNFYGQTTLTADYAFTQLFSDTLNEPASGVSGIRDASNLVLPATTLTHACYRNMFKNTAWQSIKAPKLPATTLIEDCYYGMFDHCSGLITPPELPATTLAKDCYYRMFSSCNIRTTPELPATTLTEGCYREMFSACEWITAAPELPATTLAVHCYNGMFGYCGRLTAAPDLPATTLVNQCYYRMFYHCSKLNYIKCLATDNISSWDENVGQWTSNVASTGTFIKSASATNWDTGASGIPSGWTVQDAS